MHSPNSQTVPVEPTKEMLNATTKVMFHIRGPYGDDRYYLSDEELRDIWEAMLDAAPKPSGPDDDAIKCSRCGERGCGDGCDDPLCPAGYEQEQRDKEAVEAAPAHGRLIEMGDLETVDSDGSKHKQPMSLLIRFDSVEAIRKAIDEDRCTFSFGEASPHATPGDGK